MINTIIYVESPLQFLSSLDYLNKEKQVIIFFRDSQPGLRKTISLSNFSKNAYPIKSPTSAKLIFKLWKSGSIKYIGFGYLPSVFSLFFVYFFYKSDLIMFDDGTYSAVVDQSNLVESNVRFKRLRKYIMDSVLNKRKISRYTMMNHEIKREYDGIIKWNFASIPQHFNNLELPETIQNLLEIKKNIIFYAESSLSDWVEDKYEKKAYESIISYSKKHNMHICIIPHRLSKTNEISELMNDFKDYSIIRLGFSLELFYIEIELLNSFRGNKIEFAYIFTTAFTLAPFFIKNLPLNLFRIESENFYDAKRPIANIFYDQSIIDSQKYKNINIINV